jgi:hypothetical protein
MMVVADNAAQPSEIFCCFTCAVQNQHSRPEEITVLLISLAIGLATGVGKVEVAIILTVFLL